MADYIDPLVAVAIAIVLLVTLFVMTDIEKNGI